MLQFSQDADPVAFLKGVNRQVSAPERDCGSTFQMARVIEDDAANALADRRDANRIPSRTPVNDRDLKFLESIEFVSPFEDITQGVKVSREYQMIGQPESHPALDLVVKSENKKLVAIADATVTQTGFHNEFGNFVVMRLTPSPDFEVLHGDEPSADSYYVLYAHLKSKSLVKEGQNVAAGDSIGEMGNTGASRGAHLHLELIKNLSDNGKISGRTAPHTINPQDFPHYYRAMTLKDANDVQDYYELTT